MALAAYRHLLRSTRLAFQGASFLPLQPSFLFSQRPSGDTHLLHAARSEARNGFRKNASMSLDDPALAPAIAHAEEVAKILKENVVQGKLEGDDRYSE